MNIVTGMDAPAIGQALCSDSRIRKMTFTGSTEVGRILMRQSADTVKKMSLELGGNAPLLVFDDADLDVAVEGAMLSKFRNAGQTCVCANRIFVQDGIYDAFAKRLAEKAASMTVGAGTADGVEQGPLIDQQGFDKVCSHVEDAIANGANVMAGGKPHSLGGTFFEPTVLTGMTPKMRMFREETFGPVAGLFRFTDEAEAIEAANDTEFGLAAYLFTENAARLFRVSEALEYGIVAANTGIFSSEVGPFGGVKNSGLGREGSKYGIDEFLEIKFVCIGI
jgi:succinate-semialdehyde dehydrogenase/glutarate-semialdehyde dehydrogenase